MKKLLLAFLILLSTVAFAQQKAKVQTKKKAPQPVKTVTIAG